MSVPKPYFLTVRQFSDGHYSEGGRWQYISSGAYSNHPSNYVRAFELLQKDLLELFNFIEPSDQNLGTFSFRIQELFVRTCIEVEANCKAIITMNKYRKATSDLSMVDYCLIDQSHFLSDYVVKLPYWTGDPMQAIREPFKEWKNPPNAEKPWTLSWYRDYNQTKHDRANSLHLATFENLIDAFSGLVVLMTAQYLFEDFSPAPAVLEVSSGWNDGFDSAIGHYFRIVVPRQIPEDQRYEFDWESLSRTATPFEKFDYDSLVSPS